MMKPAIILSMLLIPMALCAQKSVREYTSAQRAALQEFLQANPSYQFIPETWFDEETLAAARNEWGFGKNFKPYYQTADFNGDGRRDFAVVLRDRQEGDSLGIMVVVVFDQQKKQKYRVALFEREEFSTALFINYTDQLYVGIMETDNVGCFVPAGSGYIVEPCQ